MTPHDEARFARLISDFVDGAGFDRPFHLVVIDARGTTSVTRYGHKGVEQVCSGPAMGNRLRMLPPLVVSVISSDDCQVGEDHGRGGAADDAVKVLFPTRIITPNAADHPATITASATISEAGCRCCWLTTARCLLEESGRGRLRPAIAVKASERTPIRRVGSGGKGHPVGGPFRFGSQCAARDVRGGPYDAADDAGADLGMLRSPHRTPITIAYFSR